MSFLAPLYLAGVLAVSLPILFHLFRRTPQGRRPFSSLMFLMPSPPRVTRRSRLENLPLLLLRALILCLLALGFARPLWRQVAQANVDHSAGRWIVILVDTSASMRREDLWQQALAKVDDELDEVSPLDRVALLTFDRQPQPVVDFSTWTTAPEAARIDMLRKRLAEVAPSWNETNLGAALVTAAETIEDYEGDTERNRIAQPRRVVVVTDLQQGSKLDALHAYEWPEKVQVAVEQVAPRNPTNASLQLVQDAEMPWQADDEFGPRVRVSNAGDSGSEQFRIRWAQPAAGDTEAVDVYVPPGQSRTVRAPRLPPERLEATLRLEGDAHGFDNALYLVAPQVQHLTVLYLGRDAPDDPKQPLYYLQAAFPETPWRKVIVTAHLPDEPVLSGELEQTSLVVIAAPIPEDRLGWLRSYLHNGGTALFVVQEEAMAPTLSRLVETESLAVSEVSQRRYSMLGELDFAHPLLAPFADPRFSDFTKIHFWRHRRLDPAQLAGSRVVARFDDGDPALIEVDIEQGKLLVLTAGWHPQDSQLALSSKFVPLMHGILDQSAAVTTHSAQQYVGTPVVLQRLATSDAQSLEVRLPDGKQVSWNAAEGKPFAETSQPGIYTVDAQKSFAVNLAPEESKTAPLAVEELEALGVRLAGQHRELSPQQAEAQRRQMLAVELEGQQKLWRWLIVAALAALVLETWLAGWLSRRSVAAGTT